MCIFDEPILALFLCFVIAHLAHLSLLLTLIQNLVWNEPDKNKFCLKNPAFIGVLRAVKLSFVFFAVL